MSNAERPDAAANPPQQGFAYPVAPGTPAPTPSTAAGVTGGALTILPLVAGAVCLLNVQFFRILRLLVLRLGAYTPESLAPLWIAQVAIAVLVGTAGIVIGSIALRRPDLTRFRTILAAAGIGASGFALLATLFSLLPY